MEITTPGMLSWLQQWNLWQPSLSLCCSITRQALSLADPKLCGKARLGKPLVPRALCPLCQQSWDWGTQGIPAMPR